jgi:hypothetical protein
MRGSRIGRAHGTHQGLHHLRLDAVGQMPAVGHILEAAPAVGNLLVLSERVGDQREETRVLLEDLGQRLGRRLPLGGIGMHQEIERRLQRGRLRLSLHLEAQPRHGLAEEPAPGAVRGDRLLVEQALQLLVQLVGLLLAQVVDPRLVARQCGNL